MRAETSAGQFQFSTPVNAGRYKICVSKDRKSFFCGDIRLALDNDGKSYELRRPRSMLVKGGGRLELTLSIR